MKDECVDDHDSGDGNDTSDAERDATNGETMILVPDLTPCPTACALDDGGGLSI